MRALGLVLMIATCGVAHADQPPLAGEVRVWQDAALFVEPDGAAIHVARIDGARADHPDATIAFRVIGSAAKGKLVEVEPACTSSLRVRGLAHVHFFVARADVVTTKPQGKPPECVAPLDDEPLSASHDVIPAGTAMATPGGRAFAQASAPLAVTLVRGAKRVCLDRDVFVDATVVTQLRACVPARAVRATVK